MKILIILSTILGLCFTDFYPDTYDNFDANKYKELDYIDGVIECFMDNGKCDPEHEFFKQYIQDIFDNACARCSPSLKHTFRVFFEIGRRECPYRMWSFFNRFDPDKTLRYKLLNSVKNA